MQELSTGLYGQFKRELKHKIAWTFKKQTRLQRTQELLDTFEPFEQAAIFQAAFKDSSSSGDLVRRAVMGEW